VVFTFRDERCSDPCVPKGATRLLLANQRDGGVAAQWLGDDNGAVAASLVPELAYARGVVVAAWGDRELRTGARMAYGSADA
jgi:hypothetical protein